MVSAVVAERRQLVNVAYRLLGSLTEAEDAVQEAYARWYAMSPPEQEAIASPGAWLTRVAGRICLDLLGSARVRREAYVGEWLPEPLPDRAQGDGDPADRITLDESVNLAFLVVLESMTPAERVAFVLHDVFGYPFAEVAGILGRTPAACRQLASSGRLRVRDARAAAVPATRRTAGIVRDFRQAWEAKDIGALVGLLDPGAVMTADGGGRVRAALRPVEGAERIVRFLAGMAPATAGLTLEERTVNGVPGLVARHEGVTVSVTAFGFTDDGRIDRIWAIRNPDKLRAWNP
ncbi:RNA polymerase sigma factor SigJ [Streptomyces sp. NPDC093094]|uniref:RNA polymerase sigma factor SigJ n=1 Tax=Streptomyces sp. NPDC093094 TaxID=3366026 RepID=UPI00380FE280